LFSGRAPNAGSDAAMRKATSLELRRDRGNFKKDVHQANAG
jgi:hypothetical protein